MHGLGLLVLRMVVSVVFVSHGIRKLLPLWGGSPREVSALYESVGLIPAYPLTVGTGIVEVLGGMLLVAGAYTTWITILLAATTVATGWKLHLPNGFFLSWSLEPGLGHGYEYDLVLVASLTCLLLAGAGAFSIDGRLARNLERKEFGRARARKI